MQTLFLVLTLVLSLAAKAEVYDRILAIVNGEILTQSDFKQYEKRLAEQKLADDLFQVDYEQIKKNPKALLDFVIDQKIVDSEVRRLQLGASSEAVQAEIQNIARGLGVNVEALRARLREDKIDFKEYQEFIQKRLERQALIQREITSKIRISDDEIKSYYSRNSKNSGVDVFEYNLSHIMIPIKDDAEMARKKAEDVYAKIQQSQLNFSQAASQFSEDPNFSSGGFLGVFKSGEFLPSFENAVKALSPGEVAKPVKVGQNWILLRVNQKQIVESPEYLEQKERIRAKLTQDAFRKQFRFWLVQKRVESDIRVNEL